MWMRALSESEIHASTCMLGAKRSLWSAIRNEIAYNVAQKIVNRATGMHLGTAERAASQNRCCCVAMQADGYVRAEADVPWLPLPSDIIRSLECIALHVLEG